MNKLNRIFSIVLTAAIAVSLLVVSGVAPVSADNNLWSQVTTPSKTGQVMANNITSSGKLTMAINGDLYAYVQTTISAVVVNNLAKSTNGGRSWTYVVAPAGPISAIFCSKSEANVVYIGSGTALYKSTDGGATFVNRGSVTENITAIGAALVGGSYKVIVGTTANTYFQDEGQFFLTFSAFGTWGAFGSVLDLKLSPNFATDQGIVALASVSGTNAVVHFSTGGGLWDANLLPVALTTGASTSTGEIAFASDFSMSAAIFFVGVNGATGNVFRVTGATTATTATALDTGTGGNPKVASLKVTGTFGAATLVAGTTAGTVRYSSNSGQSWSSASKLTGMGSTYVAIKSDYATSATTYALQSAGAVNDESGFSISTSTSFRFNGASLLNSTVADINNNMLAMATNGDMYMITSANGFAVGDAFTVSSILGGTVTLTSGTVAITDGVSATHSGLVITLAAGGIATITATAAVNVAWTTTATDLVQTKTVDPDNSMTVAALLASGVDMNYTGNHSLWRYMGGNWDRVLGNALQTALVMPAVSPNYVTDKAVFYVNPTTNLINYSTNNGDSFTAQTVSAGSIVAMQVIDLNTFVVATSGAIMRTTNNGFIWNTATSQVVNMFARSSDGTAMAAYVPATGAVIKSTDLGAIWTTASTDTAQLMTGVTGIAFQNGSNNVIWATTAGGLFSIDLSATTVAWSANMASAAGTNALDSAIFTNGVAVGAGIAPTGSTVNYALSSNGSVARELSLNKTVCGTIAPAATTTIASVLFVQPAVGANKLTVIIGNAIYTFTDQLAVAVAGVTATGATGANPTSTSVVSWTAVAGADRYAVVVTQGSTATTDPYTATFVTGANSVNGTTFTFTGLATNTTYTASVWAVRTSATTSAAMVSFAGTKTFSTQPSEVGVPVNLAPANGATGIAITPGFAWGAVTGATSYTVEVSTSNTFATLVGTKQTSVIPAFAWTTPALAYNTTYYWRVVAITATGSSDPVIGVFTTMPAAVTVPPSSSTPVVTITQTNVTLTSPAAETPAYVWAIIGIGALLVIVVIVLIVRTRRVA